MASGGAPTGNWETLPTHLAGDRKIDIRQAQPRLLVRRPGVPEVEIKIDKTEFLIGRQASEVDLVLDDELVSRKHAKLSMSERGYFKLEDLGSQNKIRFADRSVRRLNVVDGDVFQIGKTEFTFHSAIQRFEEVEPASAPRREGSVVEIPEPSATPEEE